MKRIAGLLASLMPMVVGSSTAPRKAKVTTTDGTPINTVHGEAAPVRPEPSSEKKKPAPTPKEAEDDPWVIKEKLPVGPPDVTITGVHADVAPNDLDFIRACVNDGAKSPALLRDLVGDEGIRRMEGVRHRERDDDRQIRGEVRRLGAPQLLRAREVIQVSPIS
jgi:hypothetical protein